MKKTGLLLFFILIILTAHSQAQTITTSSPVQTSFCAGGNIVVPYTTTGTFSLGCIFTAELSDMWGNFSNPVNIGSLPLNLGVIPGTIPSNTTFGIDYRVRVVSSNPYIVGSVSPLPPIVITSSAISATLFTNPGSTGCKGDTIQLSTTLNASYHWSNGDTTRSINVTQSGSYKVTVTNYITNCEVTSDVKVITIHPLPVINLGPDTSICDGNVLILNAGSGNVSYNWNNGLSSSQFFFVNSTGNYFVTIKDSNNCKNHDTINVVVNPNPIVNLGNDTSFCGNVYYLDAGSGFVSYYWNNGLSFNQVLQVNHAGIYNVMVTDSNNCKAADTIVINIMHVPFLSLGNDISICGNSITLNAGDNFTSYNWNNGLAFTQYYTIIQSGSYHVVVSDSDNCKVSDTINIILNHLPPVFLGNDFVAGNNQLIVLDAGSGFSHYYWNDGSTGQTMQFNTSDLGEGVFTFWVNVIDSNGCFNSDTIKITIDFSNSINNLDKADGQNVFPNPFHEKANITLNNSVVSSALIQLNVYDALGRNIPFDISSYGNTITVNATNQNRGVYYYVVTQENHIIQKGRFVLN